MQIIIMSIFAGVFFPQEGPFKKPFWEKVIFLTQHKHTQK